MKSFQRIGLWYLLIYFIEINCIRKIDVNNKNNNKNVENNNNISKNFYNNNLKSNINENDINHRGLIFNQIGGIRFVSILNGRQYDPANGNIIDFIPTQLDSWEKDEDLWCREDIIDTTLTRGCMFCFFIVILLFCNNTFRLFVVVD